jgi:hypothetical protein
MTDLKITHQRTRHHDFRIRFLRSPVRDKILPLLSLKTGPTNMQRISSPRVLAVTCAVPHHSRPIAVLLYNLRQLEHLSHSWIRRWCGCLNHVILTTGKHGGAQKSMICSCVLPLVFYHHEPHAYKRFKAPTSACARARTRTDQKGCLLRVCNTLK